MSKKVLIHKHAVSNLTHKHANPSNKRYMRLSISMLSCVMYMALKKTPPYTV